MKALLANVDHATVIKSLPEEITKLISCLSPEDLEILAYLIAYPLETRSSAEHSTRSNPKNHSNKSVSFQIAPDAPTLPQVLSPASRQPALFDCSCFQCYTSYWSRWGASPNHGKIDEAISMYEDEIGKKTVPQKKKRYKKAEKKNEGKRKDHRGQKSNSKQKEAAALAAAAAAADKFAAGREVTTDKSLALPGPSLPEESVVMNNQRQQKEVSNVVKTSEGLNGAHSGAKGRSKQPESISSKSSPSAPTIKAKGKDLPRSSTKDRSSPAKGKSGRVVPFVEEGPMDNLKDFTAISSEDNLSTLHQGKKFWSLMANRLWGLFR